MREGTDKRALTAAFTLSPGAYAKVSGKMQVSGSTVNNFNEPVCYNVYAENRDVIKTWIVNVQNEPPVIDGIAKYPNTGLLIYPNPTKGIVHIKFSNVLTSPVTLDFYNIIGQKVYSIKINGEGTFTADVDLSALQSGIYFAKCTYFLKPVTIVIEK